MRLRPFEINDAPVILSWIADKTAFRKWSADRYPVYPPKPEDMAVQYASENIFPFMAIDDEGKVVGHIVLRYPEPSKTTIRFGFVIVDNHLHGMGYGKQMLRLAIQKARQEFGAKKITLSVFDNNPPAFHCYKSVGFKEKGTDAYSIDEEKWMAKEMEIIVGSNKQDNGSVRKHCCSFLDEPSVSFVAERRPPLTPPNLGGEIITAQAVDNEHITSPPKIMSISLPLLS